MVLIMHEADHAYSIQNTWRLHLLATDVPLIACVINSPSTFTYYFDLSNFISESGLSYFKALTICLLLVYFVVRREVSVLSFNEHSEEKNESYSMIPLMMGHNTRIGPISLGSKKPTSEIANQTN